MNEQWRNILVVNVNWVGDVIFSTPVFRALKKHFSGVRVTCLAVPRVREILQCCPHVDEIIEYDERGRHFSPLGKWNLVGELRRRRFDAALLLHGSWTRALLVYGAGIPVRAGYATKKRSRLLTHSLGIPSDDMHRSDVYLKVIESLGISVHDRHVELSVDPTAMRETEALLARHGISPADRLLVVNTGGNWDLKRWPAESFSSLIERLMQNKDWKVVVTGARNDADRAEAIAARLPERPVDLTGTTNLKQLLALMRRASVVISNDSGPLHLAASVGTPVVGLFGPTLPEITGPRGKTAAVCLGHDVGCNRAPCYYLDCPDNVCMKTITVDEVAQAVVRQLGP